MSFHQLTNIFAIPPDLVLVLMPFRHSRKLSGSQIIRSRRGNEAGYALDPSLDYSACTCPGPNVRPHNYPLNSRIAKAPAWGGVFSNTA